MGAQSDPRPPEAAPFRLGSIGGPETFAGQSTERLRGRFAWLGAPRYFSSGEALFQALRDGEVEAALGAGANLGDGHSVMAAMVATAGSGLYIVAKEPMPFGCSLLGKPGAVLDDIALVYGGHGSIAQARAFVTQRLPGARTEIYTDPIATARTVADGDGSAALLGTARMADNHGLQVIAEAVDGGIVNGDWWVISTRPRFEPEVERAFVAIRAADDGTLGRLVAALAEQGLSLASVFARPSGAHLLEFDYLLSFRGRAGLAAVEAATRRFPAARLAGALKVEGNIR